MKKTLLIVLTLAFVLSAVGYAVAGAKTASTTATCSFTVRVVDMTTRQSIAGCLVSLYPPKGGGKPWLISGVTDASGEVTLCDVPAEQVCFNVWKDGYREVYGYIDPRTTGGYAILSMWKLP